MDIKQTDLSATKKYKINKFDNKTIKLHCVQALNKKNKC